MSTPCYTLPKTRDQVKRIEIKRSNCIDQIRFIYADDTQWSIGHDGGKTDPRIAIMTDGEYIVRVTHERFPNYTCAGASVEFETNLGRILSYHPSSLASRRASEETTFHASPSKAITSLCIRRGVIEGIVEHSAPASNQDRDSSRGENWYVMTCYQPKQEDGLNSDTHFCSEESAIASWSDTVSWIRDKPGRAAILVHAHTARELRASGDREGLDSCRAHSTKAGYLLPKYEGDISIKDTIRTIYRAMNTTQDLYLFTTLVGLLFVSAWFDVLTNVMTGHMLTMFSGNQTQTLEAFRESSFISRSVCATMDCTNDMYYAILISFLIAKFSYAIVETLNIYLHSNSCAKRNQKLSMEIFKHILELDQPYFDTHSLSEIRSGMNVNALNDLVSWNAPYLMTLVLKFAMIVYFMAGIHPKLMVLSVGLMVGIQQIVLKPITKYKRQHHKIQNKLHIRCSQIQDETLDLLTPVKLFSRERYHNMEHRGATQSCIDMIHTGVVLRCIGDFSYMILQSGAFCLVLWRSLPEVSASNLTAADLTAFFLLFRQLQTVIGHFKWHYGIFIRTYPQIERVLNLLRAEPTIKGGVDTPRDLGGEIRFRGVTFSYPSRPGENTLHELDLCILPNRMTAIVGDSGSGKSTLTKLLMRLYDPLEGEIRIGGQDIRDMDLEKLHEGMAIVPQNPDLFNCSIGENISYGLEGGATQEQIEAAARLANCHDFIMKFRGGYDTFAGLRGSELSAGQKQRIAIARAAIRSPKILILDEATSSLDVENERIVQEALNRVMKGRTTIVIAHRLCTIRNADHIICIGEGQVVEQGSPTELLAKKGAYYNLINGEPP